MIIPSLTWGYSATVNAAVECAGAMGVPGSPARELDFVHSVEGIGEEDVC